ncbi:MAG: S41 family peptidase [Clostridia bacterium]|nr:S41 family peptidase [Clostridia bacterium]
MDLYERRQLRYRHIFITVMVSCIVAVITAGATFIYCAKKGTSNVLPFVGKTPVSTEATSDETINAISQSLKSFRNVIDTYYIGDIEESKLLDGAIKGYVDGLGDEYSEYMTKEEWEEYQTAALGNYVGIGIYMGTDKDGNTIVSAPIKDSPAEKAGIKTEDIIVEVDGENVLGVDSALIATKIKGEANTKVHLKIARGTEYLEFDIIREEIKIYHVETEIKNGNVGYMSLYTFDTGSAEEVQKAIKELESKGAKKFILDLRYNGGGLVDEALKIANLFIPKNKDVLITVDSQENRVVTKTENDNITNAELVVLVNEYSASASEILSGALKDNGRAKIVGTKTFGKGVIQNVFSLFDGSVLKLTVAEYFTPNETKINKEGIVPDIEVELEKVEKEEDFVDTQLNKALEILK